MTGIFKASAFTAELRAEHEKEKKRLSEEKFSPQRGENFKSFISSLLIQNAKLPSQKVDEYLKFMPIFEQAFTHPTASPNNNYESLEILGDTLCNFYVVKYLTTRFPELMNPDGSGVGTIARLKINLVSKSSFSRFADQLNFGNYIASDMLTRRDEMPSLLEDVFEAFQGALISISEKCDPNSSKHGYLVSLGPGYRIICSCFDDLLISLKYEDLYDAKTRFKQLLESVGLTSKTHYEQELEETGKILFTATLSVIVRGSTTQWKGQDGTKAGAEQKACENAITGLKKYGYESKRK